MACYQLIQSQKIPATRQAVWDFISNPANLKLITPDYMGFNITSGIPDKMYAGMIITYIVTPILGIPVKWMTEISQVKEGEYFVDEQRMGPYTFWHHQHKLESIEKGVLMTDMVTYIPPLGILGALANKLFIKNQLQQIFTYRTNAIEKKFGTWDPGF